MPGYLLEAAKPIWRATVREAPHLRAVDTDLLVAYCQTVAFYRAAKAIYDRAGGPGLMFRKGVHQGHGDQLIVHPIVGIMHDWSAEMVALGRELGLSPTSRARLGLTEPRPGDDIAATLGPARNRLAALPPPPEPGEA
jgi:P27 family predicted phage terminase small subunit